MLRAIRFTAAGAAAAHQQRQWQQPQTSRVATPNPAHIQASLHLAPSAPTVCATAAIAAAATTAPVANVPITATASLPATSCARRVMRSSGNG